MGKPATGQTDVRRTQAAESPGMGLPERESPRGDATENRCGGRPRPRRLHLRLVFLRRSPDAGQQIPQLGAGRRIPESSEQRPDEILAIVVQPRSGRHRPGSRDTRDVRTADRLCDRALLQASVVLARRRMPLLLDLRGEYVPRYVRRRLRPGRRGDRPLPRKGQGSRLPRPAPQRRAVRSGRHSQSGRRRPRAQLDDFVRLDSSQHSARLSGHPLRKGREPTGSKTERPEFRCRTISTSAWDGTRLPDAAT